MSLIFIDSDALVALNDKGDANHQKALEILPRIKTYSPYISINILLECLTVVSQRLGKIKAIELLNELRSGKYKIVHLDEKLVYQAEDIFRSIRSKNISYSDCLSFAVMRRYGIIWAFSFDVHFRKQGFKRVGIDK